MKLPRIPKRFKVLLTILVSCVLLVILLQILISTVFVQNKIKGVVANVLHEQLDAQVNIGEFRWEFPKTLSMSSVILIQNEKDSLFRLNQLSVTLRFIPLIKKKIVLQHINVVGVKSNVDQLLSAFVTDSSAGNEMSDKNKTGSDWTISAEKLSIKSSYIGYIDTELGMDLNVNVGELSLSLGTLNLDSFITIKSVEIVNSKVCYESLFVENPDTSPSAFAQILLENASLTNSSFTYLDVDSALFLETGGQQLKVSNFLLDFDKESIAMHTGLVNNMYLDLRMKSDKIDTIPADSIDLNWGANLWRVSGDDLSLKGFRYAMNNVSVPKIEGHFNSQHMVLTELKGNLRDFIIDEDTLIAEIRDLSTIVGKEFLIKDMDAKLTQKGDLFSVHGFKMRTAVSSYFLNMNTTINPTNYNQLNHEKIDIDLNVSSVSWADVDYFYPLLENMGFLTPEFPKGTFSLKTKIRGSMDHLDVQEFNFNTLEETAIHCSGSVYNTLSDSVMTVDLKIGELRTTRQDLVNGFVNVPTEFGTFSIPELLSLKGNYTLLGFEHAFNGTINSEIGHIEIPEFRAVLGNMPSFKIRLDADLHHLSAINYNGVNAASFQVAASYTGENLYNANGDIQMNIESIQYRNMIFRNALFESSINQGNFLLAMSSDDSGALFNAKADGYISDKKKRLNLSSNFKNLDLRLIVPDADTVKVEGEIVLNSKIAGDKNAELNLHVNALNFDFSDGEYSVKPTVLYFSTSDSSTLITSANEYYHLNFNTKAYLLDVFSAFSTIPKKYVNKIPDSTLFKLPEFNVDGQLIYPEEFMSHFNFAIPSFKMLTLNGKHEKANREFNLNLNVTETRYHSVFLDSLNIHVLGSGNALELSAFSDIKVGDLLEGKLWVNGRFKDSKLWTNVTYNDSYGQQYLNITTLMDTLESDLSLQIIPDSLLFNYEKWVIHPQNRITLKKEGVEADFMRITNKNQLFSFQRNSTQSVRNVEFELRNFNIEKTEYLFAMDTFVNGLLSAKIQVLESLNKPIVKGELYVDKTNIYGVDIGKIKFSNILYNDYLLKLDMLLEGNVGNIKASTQLHNMQNIEAQMEMQKLELNELNYLLEDYIKDARGRLQANVTVSGTTKSPRVNGNLIFNEAGMEVLVLHEYFNLGDDRILLEDNVLHFQDFSIENSKNQRAKVNGRISLSSGTEVHSDLLVQTDNMELMNSTKKDNDVLFGLLKAKADVSIKGNTSNTKIKANVVVDETTEVSYVFPEKLFVNDNKGIVTFGKFEVDTLPLLDVKKSHVLFGFGDLTDIESTIEVKKGTQFKMYFDEGGENYLDASLSGMISYFVKGKNNEIAGVLQLDRGDLHYKIPMVNVDNFTIEPGSSITLSNDIYNPYVNIVAFSSIRASTEGLVEDYAKVMNFKVLLYLQGDLNNLKLRFDISQETNDAIISSKLAQLTDKERNINALNLLVRGTFVISFQGAGADATTSLQAQLDKIYTNQLNNLISHNVKFVDLHFDVQSYEDYGAGGSQVFRRNLYYEVGKSFWNKRARVNYKGSLGFLENAETESINTSFAQNYLEVEVKIDKEGTLHGLFFRKDQYEGLLEGQVIETGVGLRISKDYYSIKDIFVNEDNKRAKALRDKQINGDN